MTRRRLMLLLGIVTAAVCAFALVQAVRAQPPSPCPMDHPCSDNPSCTNDDYCMGPCKCDRDENKCIPL